MSLSPLSAIAEMVTPVVLITMSVIFANGLISTINTIGARLFTLNEQQMDILTGPHGEELDVESLAPMHGVRLTQIRDEEPVIMRRVGRLRNAALLIWISIGIFVLSVAAIAVATTARSEAVAFVALALVMAGVGGVFASIATVLTPLSRSASALIEETRRTRMLG
ncbi:MAG TPA: hypothetical protein VEV61_17635 [Streptosporangiaceae bacterium]|nr:hypothetical protein [Streptosporangiaceae bacterium]